MKKTIELDPILKEFSTFVSNEIEYEKQFHLKDEFEGGCIDLFGYFREASQSLICLMPAAQPSGKDIIYPIFHRWSWFNSLPNCSVISVSDPALSIQDINASWFISDKIDFIEEIYLRIKKIAELLKMDDRKIIVYGSSMWGFGSLMLASHFDGASAIAEVPQINFLNYPFSSAIKNVETKMLGGLSIDEFYSVYPERVDALSRFKKLKKIPPLKIITNINDEGYQEHCDLIQLLPALKDDVNSIGDIQIKVLSKSVGHKPLDTSKGIKLIREAITEGWEVVTHTQETKTDLSIAKSYEQTLNEGIELAKKIRYIRNESDSLVYHHAKELFYEAGRLNPQADWPFLKLCSMIKLWTNSFNNEMFDVAKVAISRKESLEGFIYFCRGALYNLSTEEALSEINQKMLGIKDPQIANIGNIFKSICSYELFNYKGYRESISVYLDNKESKFEPYISIPVSTVYLEDGFAPTNYNSDSVFVLGEKLKQVNFDVKNKKYVISISCDIKYLKIYGQYLIESFKHTCSEEAVMHICVLSVDHTEDIANLTERWGSKSVVITTLNLDVKENIGPIASLLRFSYLYLLLDKLQIPVVILDLDTVIKRPLSDLVEQFSENDICSRILGYGVAPWEKYTGGFSIFYPTQPAILVAKNIAYVAEKTCRNDKIQWWIDQNCFEAGIRSLLENNEPLKLENVMQYRDSFCVMPVGSQEAKLHVLTEAVKNL
jgi:predicted nucleic-acid-binding Zn-ribbon protein